MAKRSKSVSKNPEDKVGFRDFTNVFEKLEKITSDNSLREHVSDFVQGLSSEEVRIFSYFVLGKIGPDFDDIDLGLAEKMVKRALSEKFGKSLKDIDSVLKKTGDLGEVAEKFSAAKGADLTPGYVFDMLWRIQKAGGEGSQEKKLDILKKILDYASGIEACYVIRIVLGKLRLGVGEKTLISAFSHAFSKADDKPEEVKSVIEDKYNIDPDIGSVGRIMSKSGLSGIKRIRISIGRPIVPMLAQRINSFDNLLKKMPEDIAAEEKYDGERVQIHKDDDKVILFSRRLGNISSQYPEIVDASKKNIKAEKCILDGEIVPFEKNKIGTFQELMQRRRKYDVEKYAKEIPVAVFLFDLLYLEGKSCIRKSYPKRRKLLESVIDKSRYIKLAGRIVSQDISKIREFFKKCLDKGLEGIIAKSTADNSLYRAGKRGWLWIKWKKEYAHEMQDTFDLVVIGSFRGKGRRKSVFGALLCALYNKDNSRFESFTKVGSGYTDKDFRDIMDELETHKTDKQLNDVVVEKEMQPDEYYEPKIVIEVVGAEITESPLHTAGKSRLNKEKGLALRFPRFIRIRPDKKPKQATSVNEVIKMRT